MKIRRIKNTAEKFRNRIAKMQTDNRGLTLIELVITVAIIAIFSGVVMTFIMTGSNTYRSTSSNAKVQMETQELVDRMEDLIIDTNRSLYYANGTGENTGSEIKNDIKQSGDGNSDGNKTFIVCNEYKNNDGNTSQYICDVIDWDKEDATVYYSQREYTATSSSDDSGKNDTETAALSEDEEDVSTFSLDEEDSGEQNVRNVRTKVNRSVLATGILDFRADLTKVESDNIVRFQLSTENGKKEIETLHSVSLRNKVKVKKPADSVDDPEPTDVGIRISYAPASMDPGASDRLAYNLSGNGSIDPSTITWSVVSDGQNGSFPGEDHTNSRLTINGNASGSITVKVSAKTSSGKWIESAPVTIQITAKATPAPTEAPEPKELKISTEAVLVAVGSSYNLNDILSSVSLIYDDGTSKDIKDSVTWAKVNDCYGMDIQGTILTVSNQAGETASKEVVLEATDSASGLKAQVIVKLAKLKLTAPAGKYKVNDQKPLEFTYTESAAKVELDAAALSLTARKSDASADATYDRNAKFTSAEIGDWVLSASYDLSVRGGFGTVYATSSYAVETSGVPEEEGEIVPNQKSNQSAYAVVKNRAYTCGVYGRSQDFAARADSKGWTSKIVWSIEYGNDVTVTQGNNGLDSATVTAGENCDGYVLCAKYELHSYSGEVIKKVTARKYVSVIKGIEIVGIPDVITAEQTYKVGVNVIMKGITKDSAGNYISEDQTVYAEQGNGNTIIWKQPNGYYLDIPWGTSEAYVYKWGAGNTMTLHADVNALDILVKDADGVGYLTDDKILTIVK